ncbi:transporter substrate-binding domain-containing protein [uncultured Paraglaciecola sp.]|uniref:substrate-binding periplasmic protein n=1 Tax=uncultured Paraglaciecola sp. TaxID=1765024 RepID=UPI0025919785|nr:transporter substrate-binding domain-containing protein [uncultured Paraglaciecola sp.]
MTKGLSFFLVALFLFLSCPTSAKTFLGHCRNYPPELYFENGKCKGVIPDLVSDILSELGIKVKWQKVPWGRSIIDAQKGNVDLLIRHSMTPAREYYLNAIKYADASRTLSFFKSPNFKPDISSYEELVKVNVGAIRGVFYSPEFSKLDFSQLTLVSETEQLLGMLELGRIDVVVTSKSHSIYLFESNFEKVSLQDTFENPYFISIPDESKMMAYFDDISRLMLEYRQSGRVEQYFEKHLAPIPTQIFDELDNLPNPES